MRDLIKKILKEEQEEDDGFNWADTAVNSPAQVLETLEVDTEWIVYIPEISRHIQFHINPESNQPMARVQAHKVESRGHGSFGDDPHKHFQPNPVDNFGFGRSNWIPDVEPVGEDERGNKLYNVVDVAHDMKGYSDDARQLTLEYRQKIQQLTNEYVESIRSLHTKYNFDTSDGWGNTVDVATVDSQGRVWTDDEWDRTHGGGEYKNYPGSDEVWQRKRRDFPPRL